MRFSYFIAFLALSGCGSAYISPTVKEVPTATATSPEVRVVPMTIATVEQANRSPYSPKRLPRAFSQITKIPGLSQSVLSTPAPVTSAVPRPTPIETILPAKLKPTPYRIGVADVLLLATPTTGATINQLAGLLAAQNKRQGYTVQDDGAIAIPDVGRVQVAGLTLDEAEAEIFKALLKKQMNPTFSLAVSGFNSQRVTVGGAVGKPTLVPITLKPLHLGEALQLAGGITARNQDYATIRLFRDGKLYQMPLTSFLAKASLQNILLKNRDSVYVDTTYNLTRAQAYFAEQIQLLNLKSTARSQALTQLRAEISIARGRANERRANYESKAALDAVPRDYVYLSGEIAKQGRFTLPFGREATLADALYSKSGITTTTGDMKQIYLIRSDKKGNQVTAYHLDAENIANMVVATRMELRPNDIIFVAEQPVTKWNRALSQMGPSFVLSAASRIK